jgi:hypothetical protein
MKATPEEVLDYHVKLTTTLRNAEPPVLSFFTWFIQDSWEKNFDRAAGMFYPLIRPERRFGKTRAATGEDGRKLAHLIADGLAEAVTYQVTAEMVQVMRQTWERSMRGKIFHLDRRDLPGEAGFAYLDEPWQMFDVRGDSDQVRAVSWEYTTAWVRKEHFLHDMPWAQPSVRLSLWTSGRDDAEADRLPEHVRERVERELGHLTLLHTAVVPFDLRLELPHEQEAAATSDSMTGLVHMLWTFLGMEIVGKHRPPVQRAFRRRALRSIKHGEVHVVQLRRLAATGEDRDREPGEVDWTCTWVVQGHWRHWEKPLKPHHAVVLYGEEESLAGHDPECHKKAAERPHRHCITCGGAVSWVKPYIKGPDGMPLKVSRTLMLLAR